MIKIFISQVENGIVLDFFAGSGSTAHAVLSLNAEDKGERKFILVQLPEAFDIHSDAYKAGYKTIADLAIDRIKRANKKLDGSGFKVFRLGESNYPENTFEFDPDKTEVENQKAFESYLAKAKQTSLFDDENGIDIVYENIIKEGFSLNAKVTEQKIGKNNVFVVSDEIRTLTICLDRKVEDQTVKELTGRDYKGHTFICIDNALDDTSKANLGLNLELKTI